MGVRNENWNYGVETDGIPRKSHASLQKRNYWRRGETADVYLGWIACPGSDAPMRFRQTWRIRRAEIGEGAVVELRKGKGVDDGGGGRLNLDEGLWRRSLMVTGKKTDMVGFRQKRALYMGWKAAKWRGSCSRCKFWSSQNNVDSKNELETCNNKPITRMEKWQLPLNEGSRLCDHRPGRNVLMRAAVVPATRVKLCAR
jgi:hypothetical protein